MKPTCNDPNTTSGNPCGNKVPTEGDRCYRHKKYAQSIPKDISQVVGKKPKLIVIDDIDENGDQIIPPKEVFKTVIIPQQDIITHSTDIIHHSGTNTAHLPDNIEYLNPTKPNLNKVEDDTTKKDYSIIWKRIKNFFKRGKKDE